MSDKRLTTLRPNGWLFVIDGDGLAREIESVQCCHCGGHFLLTPGSGRVRGFCMNCQGPVCGPQCERCLPTEKLLECLEKGIHPDQLPVSANVSADVPKSAGGIALPPGVEG